MRISTVRIHGSVLALVALVGFPASVLASRSGPIPGVTGSPASGGPANTCAVCHAGSGGGSGSVQILSAPAAYAPGTDYLLTVKITDPTQAAAGFQLSVEDPAGVHVGTLAVVDAVNTQLNGLDPNFINHTLTGVNNSATNWVANGSSASYQIKWTAPATDIGPVTFWAAGNAVNNTGASNGDHVYTTNVTASAAEPIPTVSEWGALALAMSLLTAGTILVGRRTPRAC
ncbi:MAG: hypothetical protein HY763_01230 [Planctomycetes bacterium]|nr:hypothetical protein [Planctomycetota bacterium]